MSYQWETDEERTLRFMKISPIKKMEWLREMNEFSLKASSKQTMILRRKLKELRAISYSIRKHKTFY